MAQPGSVPAKGIIDIIRDLTTGERKMPQGMFNLEGRVAVVTGGGSGLGKEFCDVLAEYGARVVCVDIRLDRVEEVCAMIGKYGNSTLAVQTDVSKYDQVKNMYHQVIDKFGRVDILVTSAGVAPPVVLIDEIELEDWHRVIDIDLNGVFYCLKEGLAIMKKQGKGSVITISSVAGLIAVPPQGMPQAAYVAAKHAVVGLTKQAAAEFGQFGIRANCIAPGLHLPTGLPESMGYKSKKDTGTIEMSTFTSNIPLRRAASPSEMKGLVLFLASDASSYMTGATLVQDGGLSIC
jgi:NAD(P)-dependent dehydrogenase (short-subunit alcohol dehydrogenase family)